MDRTPRGKKGDKPQDQFDKREAIKKELAELLAAGFIKEVYHPDWLANPVLI